MVGLSSRCGCRCQCVTSTTHGNNKDPPDGDAILEGLAMAGLVAILRQLGDLAELAADVLDDMQDQVMAASARGRRLAVRAKRLLEADLDLLPTPTTSASCGGAGRLGCHPRGGEEGSGAPPRLVVQRIRRCRGPPSLSLLDKFDAAGEGACLKRYTDPSFFFRAHSARLQPLVLRAPYLLKSMSMETRPKFQTALNSEPPHTDSKSETETDASETPSPGFLSMLPQLKQQTLDRVQSSPQLNMEHKLQGGGTAQPSPSPSELERTSSFEAWLSPDACAFTTATGHHEHDEIITPQHHGASAAAATATATTSSNADASLSSSTMLKANKTMLKANKGATSWRYKAGSVEMVASRVSSLPRKLFSNIKHHNSDPPGTSLRISQPTAIGELQQHAYNVSVDADRHHQHEDQCSNSNSNSSTPESLVLKRTGALPENSSSEDAKVDTTPPLPPMQWLSETGTRAASPKHRELWKKSQQLTEMIKAIRQAHRQTPPVDREETLASNGNTSANVSHVDEMKRSESEETRHPQPFRVSESSQGIVLKAGEFPVPAVLSDDAWSEIDPRTQAQADTCFQQQFYTSEHSDEKRSGGHEASDSSSNLNLQQESVFLSAVQELAKMSSVPRPKYSLLDAGCHGRITLRNGPSLIHPSRNILDSRSVLIKDIATADNSSFKLKPVSGTSSPQSPVAGSPTNSKVATILQRADDIRKAHADRKDVDSEEESWSDDSE